MRISVWLLTASLALPMFGAKADELTDEQITRVLQERVDIAKKTVGIVVGIVDDKGVRIVSHGKAINGGDQNLDGDSVFEIGSISKVFTATLLANMVERGEVALNDPISKYLPNTVKVPSRNGREITLEDLATQRSGLPRLPGNFSPKDDKNPYADYSVEQMYAFLSGYTLTRDIGSKYEYSNLGVGLLGHILALRAGTDYESLVRARILQPLGMRHTGVKLTPYMKSHLATGHDNLLQPVPNWDIPTLPGAGGLRSTVNDMLKFAAANLRIGDPVLAASMQATQQVRQDTTIPYTDIGLAWHISKRAGAEITWHNGGSGGYRSYIGLEPKKRIAVVVLTNANYVIDDIGRHLLASQFPLKVEVPKKQE
jgi:D-alanyl-D-alanine-carboxypeptidase/D-alanyl-D-alanine-endopeptidase